MWTGLQVRCANQNVPDQIKLKLISGKIEYGGNVIEGNFVEPTIISGLPHDSPVVHKETFAPIVYVLKSSSVDQAIKWNNEVEQGLTSSIFTKNVGNMFKVSRFLLTGLFSHSFLGGIGFMYLSQPDTCMTYFHMHFLFLNIGKPICT